MRRRTGWPARLATVLTMALTIGLAGCSGGADRAAPAAAPPAGGAASLPGPVPVDLALRPVPAGAPAAPAVTGTLTDGTSLTVGDLWAQRPVVLTFFSSWCTTCTARQDALSELARTHRDRVVFVGVASVDEADDLQEYLRTHRVEYPVIVDDEQTIWRSYAVREPPAVAVVARGGALLRGWPGGLDAPTLDRQLRALVLAEAR